MAKAALSLALAALLGACHARCSRATGARVRAHGHRDGRARRAQAPQRAAGRLLTNPTSRPSPPPPKFGAAAGSAAAGPAFRSVATAVQQLPELSTLSTNVAGSSAAKVRRVGGNTAAQAAALLAAPGA
jgi:hypothetical protein